MKKKDLAGIAFVILFVLAVAFFPLNYGLRPLPRTVEGEQFFWAGFRWTNFEFFGNVTKEYPYIMGFFKFLFLATFGEMLKQRIKTGNWKISALVLRAIVWGLFGMVMTLAFALFAGGVSGLMGTPLWFGTKPAMEQSFANTFIFAFSTSLLMNAIFAYPMMLAHEWCNCCIAAKKFLGGEAFFSGLNAHVWGSFIPKTILYFWIPAHTATFLLPAEFRVLVGAALSTALGFILTITAGKQHNK